MNYLWDDQLHLYKSETAGEFGYSDGPEVEQRLLAAVSGASDRGTFSRELAQHIQDWPSEYHLSQRRHCLLRPLKIGSQDNVLELGAGCGALTRFLGEIGAVVVAVEGSLTRARIAAERCRDLSNVRVVVEDLLRFETGERFDYVLLVGVLEYAALFARGENPFASYLQVVSRFLKPDGKLVVAIENQLGLKYFNGCSEDHVARPFFGVQDLYGRSTVRTFGRRELTSLLSSAGFASTCFYYPFPDYKLPSVVLSESGIADPDFDAADVIGHCHALDYHGSGYRGFDDALALSVLHRNGLLAELSNSFLVVGSTAADTAVDSSTLAFSWSANRIAEFCTQTNFVRQGREIQVIKKPLTSSPTHEVVLPGGIVVRHHTETSIYRKGTQVLSELLQARARSGEHGDIVKALQPWMTFLREHAKPSISGELRLADYTVPENFVDCTPSNLLRDGNDLVTIDLEWHSDRPVPLGWVVTRGVIWSLGRGVPRSSQPIAVSEIVVALCRAASLSVDEADIQRWIALEACFQTAVTGRQWQPEMLQHMASGVMTFTEEIARSAECIRQKQIEMDRLTAEAAANVASVAAEQQQLRAQLAAEAAHQSETKKQLESVLQSRSWKLTSVLRWARRLL